MSDSKRPSSETPEQLNRQPGRQSEMRQQPQSDKPDRQGSGKLKGKIAIVTGGDSGIGRATAIVFAKPPSAKHSKNTASPKKLPWLLFIWHPMTPHMLPGKRFMLMEAP